MGVHRPTLYGCEPPRPPLKKRKGHCDLCGIKSEAQYCPECAQFLKTGHWFTDDMDVDTLLEFITEVWGSEMTRASTQDVIDNDPTIAFAQDSMRGAYQGEHEVIG